MKKSILYILTATLLYSCSQTIGQRPSEEMKKEEEFNNLMKKVSEMREQNKAVMNAVDNQTKQVVEKTAQTITSLKEENKMLKQEINETGKKSYFIDDTISNFKFNLRPVSNGKENR